jgi:hypothetical protein
VNTNTGYFGLRIRSDLLHNHKLRQWISYSTVDRSHDGSTMVRLKNNPAPTLPIEFDLATLLPTPSHF